MRMSSIFSTLSVNNSVIDFQTVEKSIVCGDYHRLCGRI